MLCVENVYVDVNMYVTLWSYPLTDISAETRDRDHPPAILFHDSVSSTWFWSCYFKVKMLPDGALNISKSCQCILHIQY